MALFLCMYLLSVQQEERLLLLLFDELTDSVHIRIEENVALIGYHIIPNPGKTLKFYNVDLCWLCW